MSKWLILLLVCAVAIPASTAAVQQEADDNTTQHSCGLAPKMNVIADQTTSNIINTNGPTAFGEPFYAYVAYDPAAELPEGPCFFSPSNPAEITSIAPTSSNNFISGATWANGQWYGCEYGSPGDTDIYTIDPNTGDMTVVGSYDPGSTGIILNGLAYDKTSGTMYACSSYDLYTIDMDTGASTQIGTFPGSPLMIAIDFDHEGNLYGIDIVNDSLYEIDTATAVTTLVGLLGYNLNYAQDMAYDSDTNTMYASAYDWVTGGGLYTINLGTGAMTFIDNFKNAAEVTGFAIPTGASVQISSLTGGLGLSLLVKNLGSEAAENVVITATFTNSTVFLPLGGTATRTIASLPSGEEQIVRILFFGFAGLLRFSNLVVTVEADNSVMREEIVEGKLALIFVII